MRAHAPKTANRFAGGRSTRSPLRIAAIALPAVLAACAYPVDPIESPLPHEQFEITVRETRSVVEVPVASYAHALTYQDIAALQALTREYLAAGHGPIVIALPRGAGNEQAAVHLDAQARDVIYEAGVAYAMIQGAAYDATGMTDAPLVVMVDRYVADAPDCHQSWADFARSSSGANTLNFGCAVRANIAAVVTDPADFLGPRDETAPDATRRGEVFTRYRAGESTTTVRGVSEGVAVSDAVE